MNIPIELFAIFIATAIGFAIFGFIREPRIPALLAFAGMFILVLSVTTTNIQIGYSESKTVEQPNYFVTYPMEQPIRTGATTLNNLVTGVAEKPFNINSVIFNKTISCIQVNLIKTNTPTGMATIGILDPDNMITRAFGTIDVSTINTASRNYQFCLPNHDYWVISGYDRIGIKYNGGSATNTVGVGVSTGNPFDGTNTVQSTYTSGAWSDTTGNDLTMILTTEDIGIDTLPISKSSTPNLFAFTQLHKVLFALLGVVMILTGGLMVARNKD